MSFQIHRHNGNFLLPPLRSLRCHLFFFTNYMHLLCFILDRVRPETVKNLTVDRIEYDPKRRPDRETKVTISLITPKGAYFKRYTTIHRRGGE